MDKPPRMFDELLVFVVGKSGSGKDTLMRETTRLLSEENVPIKIFVRHITRPSDKNEESHFLSVPAFLALQQKGEFDLSWEIYGNHYGISRFELERLLTQQMIVLVNVSRSILFDARKKYPNSKIVLIEVPSEIARKRVESRGRDTGKYLDIRLQRMQTQISMPSANKIIKNEGSLNSVVQEFCDYLNDLYHQIKK